MFHYFHDTSPFQWLFAQNVDEGGWSYNEELRRARRILKSSKKDIVEDLQFDHTAHTVPDDVDRTYFPNMQCGDVIRTREEAAQILQELTEQKLTIPLLPERVWQVSLGSSFTGFVSVYIALTQY